MDRLAQLPKLLRAKYGERYPRVCIALYDDGTSAILTDRVDNRCLKLLGSVDELYAHLTEEK